MQVCGREWNEQDWMNSFAPLKLFRLIAKSPPKAGFIVEITGKAIISAWEMRLLPQLLRFAMQD